MVFKRLQTLPARGSCFLFGPRQTGKSTLVRSLLPPASWTIDLLRHDEFLRFAKEPSRFRAEAQEQIRRGRLFEQWVVTESSRLVDYRFPETRLFYWRTSHGAEVDLLFERHGKLRLAVEIKSGRRITGAVLSGLRSFAEAHPAVPRVVVGTVPEPFRMGTIEVLPWRRFFEELGRFL